MKRRGIDRFVLLLFLAGIAFVVLEVRLLILQVGERPFWVREAQKIRTRARSLPFERGLILDRNRTPLAITQGIFELHFTFRNFRLHSPAGHIGMIYFLWQGKRPSFTQIYQTPEPYIQAIGSLTPGQVYAQEDRWKRTDLLSYLKWLFELTEAEQAALFKDETQRSSAFLQVPWLRARLDRVVHKVVQERESLYRLEETAGLERNTLLDWPDRAADRADRMVKSRLGEDAPLSYLKLRNCHREIDSYENRVLKDMPHRAAVGVTVAERRFPGFYIVESTRRFYPESTRDVCPLLIGRTGLPNARELGPLDSHRKRLEEIFISDSLSEEDLLEEEGLRLMIREIDILPGEEVGRLGLEAFLEPVLRGKRGYILEDRGAAEKTERILGYSPPIRGEDVVLTLDAELQRVCERALLETGFPAAAVIMDAHSGAVLAMATTPKPARRALNQRYGELAGDPAGPLLQRAVYNNNLPPPGSIAKIFTAVAALEEGVCTREDLHECQGRLPVGNTNMKCEGIHNHLALEEAITKSCNIYFYKLGVLLGYEKLFDWAGRFGFGRRTGYLDRALYGLAGSFSGFPEGEGKLKLHEQGQANLMRLAIGQGAIDDVTPMQVARMMAGVATGKLPQPHLLAKIGGRPFLPPVAQDLGVSDLTWEIVRAAMIQVVEVGTAAPDSALNLDLTKYQVAGKTGTPQVGGTHPSHACFGGYFPHSAPRWSFAVFVESCDLHGGEIAAPALNRILASPEAEFLLQGGTE